MVVVTVELTGSDQDPRSANQRVVSHESRPDVALSTNPQHCGRSKSPQIQRLPQMGSSRPVPISLHAHIRHRCTRQ